MSDEIEAAKINSKSNIRAVSITTVAAFLLAALSYSAGIFTQRAVSKAELLKAHENNLWQARMKTYPEAFACTVELSARRRSPQTQVEAVALGHRLNAWLYGEGGLVAGAETRKAVADVRTVLMDWKDDTTIAAVRECRNRMIIYLRADLGLKGDLTTDSVGQPPTAIDSAAKRIGEL